MSQESLGQDRRLYTAADPDPYVEPSIHGGFVTIIWTAKGTTAVRCDRYGNLLNRDGEPC